MTRGTPSGPEAALARLEAMIRRGEGLELLLDNLPAGATLADARRFRERVKQQGRRPCSFLDRTLGVRRA